MVLVHSFYLLGAVNFVHGVVAQDSAASQPLSRLANGFIVEYADDPQTHSVVSSPFLVSAGFGRGMDGSPKACGGRLPLRAHVCHAAVSSLETRDGTDRWPSSVITTGLGERDGFDFHGRRLTLDRMSCKKLLLKCQMSRACKFRTRWTLGAPFSMVLLSKSRKAPKMA